MRISRIEKRQATCEHRHTVTTVLAGITRVVCEECGNVSVGHHHDLVPTSDNPLTTSAPRGS